MKPVRDVNSSIQLIFDYAIFLFHVVESLKPVHTFKKITKIRVIIT